MDKSQRKEARRLILKATMRRRCGTHERCRRRAPIGRCKSPVQSAVADRQKPSGKEGHAAFPGPYREYGSESGASHGEKAGNFARNRKCFVRQRFSKKQFRYFFDNPVDRKVSPLPCTVTQILNLSRGSFCRVAFISAEILRISGRGNCKEAFLLLGEGFPGAKIASSSPYMLLETMKVQKGFDPHALSCGF